MTTTPEQVAADALNALWSGDTHDGTSWRADSHEARTIAEMFRAAGLLGGDPTEEQIEAVARELACLDEGDSWPTNAQLGGSLTGDRDVEYREGMREQARDLLLVAARAAGVAPQDELPVASALPVGDDSGHAGGDDRGSREDGPEEEGCSHQVTVAVTPSPDREKLIAEARDRADHMTLLASLTENSPGAVVAREEADRMTRFADALVAAPVVDEAKLDPEKVAEVINRALDRWEGNESSEVFVAQAICEAEVEGRLRGGGR
ncbi:hypothetical protein [Leucobacter ruminantium]|uniref:Uncharacterized protein n=1 Tax=Leucobacter ruminantium TaxID=1289170 RepID=A0A939LWR3_9MICO|nr:hypothetical protein [Leucobacter ruminantium]MBO1805856.1 hypothetical protein [Leucobacter ruminantium]